MEFMNLSVSSFVEALASKSPVPGGGGASAMVGAVGVALSNMVGSLTLGKKKYADVEDEIASLKARADFLQAQLLTLAERDAEVFEPLSRAYGLPKETDAEKENKRIVMQKALDDACSVPLEIMEKCAEATRLCERFAEVGAAIAISDAGVSAAMIHAALRGASLNVFINTRAMTDQGCAARYNDRANRLLQEYLPRADRVFQSVAARLI